MAGTGALGGVPGLVLGGGAPWSCRLTAKSFAPPGAGKRGGWLLRSAERTGCVDCQRPGCGAAMLCVRSRTAQVEAAVYEVLVG